MKSKKMADLRPWKDAVEEYCEKLKL